MSSYASVYLSDGRPVCSFRDGVDQLFFILFTRQEWIELKGQEAKQFVGWAWGPYEDEEGEEEIRVTGFRTPAATLRDRLDLLGVPSWRVAAELERLATEKLEIRRQVLKSISAVSGSDWDRDEVEYLTGLTWERWLGDLRTALSAGQPVERWGRRESVGSASWLMSLWDDHDPRYQLRAVLEALSGDEVLILDLHDLLDGGHLEPSVDPRDHARELVAYASEGGLAPIVLTEGRFDVEVLTAAVELRRPHLVDYLRFPDFQRNEGGAAALRQTIRAFAAAGIPNRVVGLFDNDTAARDVIQGMRHEALPANLVVTRLPQLEMARSYPTVGPQGELVMDVNGLASSIEMYLGTDVLAVDGRLRPVIWGGNFSRLGSYQGEISDKGRIHDRFREKVDVARRDRAQMAHQDWSGLDLVLDHIVDSVQRIELTEP